MRVEHRVTFVGDTGVGKTSLLNLQYYLEPHIEVTANNAEILDLKLEDTQASPDYDKLRPLIYSITSCFVLCYSIDSPCSLENIFQKWLPEIKKHIKRLPPFIILGLKSDLEGKVQSFRLAADQHEPPAAHLRCSALKMQGLKEVTQAAADAILNHSNHKNKKCTIF